MHANRKIVRTIESCNRWHRNFALTCVGDYDGCLRLVGSCNTAWMIELVLSVTFRPERLEATFVAYVVKERQAMVVSFGHNDVA